MARVPAGHQRAAGRRAYRGAGISLGKADALGGQPIQVRRQDPVLAITAEMAIAQIISQDEDNVRRLFHRHPLGLAQPSRIRTLSCGPWFIFTTSRQRKRQTDQQKPVNITC